MPAAHHYPSHPFVGVGVVVWREDKVLLVKRKNPPAQGLWSLPGGKQKLGETIFEAAVREVREETGLKIDPTAIITALDAISRDKAGKVEFHYTLVEVSAEAPKGKAKADDDALEVMWASFAEVQKLCKWGHAPEVVRKSMLERML